MDETRDTATRKSVLIVDDDPVDRALIRRILRPLDLALTEVADGETALETAQSKPFDLIITDIFMPKMEGIELVRCLREIAPDLPILVVSGTEPSMYMRHATTLGASDAVDKKDLRDQLLDKVRALLAD